MNLRTAIVEDSKPDAERLKQLLKKAFENENISCSCFASGDEFLRTGGREGKGTVSSSLSGRSVYGYAQSG